MAVTLADLTDEVLIIVRDTSATVANMIVDKLNEALFSVVDEVTIPELKRIGLFTTVVGQAWANMPAGFNGKLLFVGNDNAGLAIALGGVKQLMENDPLLVESGPVHTVALEGNVLYYQGIPEEATSYPMLYMEWPELMTDVVGVPDYIPPHLQTGLFVHKAAALIFDIIEDGVEGEKVNMMAQNGLHNHYLDQFRNYVSRRRYAYMRSVWSN